MDQIPTNSQPINAPKSVPKSAPPTARSKANLAYWEDAIFQRRARGNWWMILQHAGQRRKLSLGTPLKAAAAAKARDTYLTVLHKGWEQALAMLRPERAVKTEVTIGHFLAELALRADLKPKTLEGYAVAFRGIVADIFGIEGGKEKYDHKGGGRAKWIEKIHAVRLDAVTPERVQEWKRAFIARAGDDPIKQRSARQRSARTSFNSFLRGPKACSRRTRFGIYHLRSPPRSRLRGSPLSPGSPCGTAHTSTRPS